MRMSYNNVLIAVCLPALLAIACERETLVEEPGDLIRISATSEDVQTRGLLNAADLPKVGTEVKVYDYLTGFEGTIGGATGDVMYIDDVMECVTAASAGDGQKGEWKFQTADWRWTRSGVHHFFGWLKSDNSGTSPLASPFGETFDESTRKLTVPAFTIADNTDQFDFSYSNIVTKTAPEDVEIPLKHLFTALKVQVKNTIPSELKGFSVSFFGIMNGRSATIDYSATPSAAGETDVTAIYSDGALADFILANAQVTTIPAAPTATEANPDPTNDPVALYTDNDGYLLLWPQDNLGTVTAATETEEGDPVSTATVSFTIGDDTYVNTLTGSLKDIFPDNKMEAGKKYTLTIIVSPLDLRFLVTVDPLDNMNAKPDTDKELFNLES